MYHNAVNHVPNFQLSARSSSFFGAVFPSILWSNFFWDTQYKVSIHHTGLTLVPSEKYHFQIEDHAVSFFIHDLAIEDAGEYTLLAAGEAMTAILKVHVFSTTFLRLKLGVLKFWVISASNILKMLLSL